jgi:hypothetical protein
MAQSKDLGQKFTCFKCECKFYDLGAPEPICPRCGADQRENPELGVEAPAPKKRGRKAAKSKVEVPDEPTKDDDEDSLLDDDFDTDDASLEEGLKSLVAERMPDEEAIEEAPAKKKAASKKKASSKKSEAKS